MTVERPVPVTLERIAARLRAREESFGVAEVGLTGIWDGHRIWFLLQGSRKEIVQVRGRLAQPVRVSQRVAALRAVNDWNRNRIWPKAYLRPEDEGQILYTEMSTDFQHGATDAQLAAHLGSAIVAVTIALTELGPALGVSGPPA